MINERERGEGEADAGDDLGMGGARAIDQEFSKKRLDILY